MRQAVQVVQTPVDDRQKLIHLSLSAEGMSSVGIHMLEAMDSASPLGAATSAGFYRYDGGLRALGQYFAAGWQRRLDRGVERLVRLDGRVAIQMLSVRSRKTKNSDTVVAKFRRGAATRESVFTNGQQLGLFSLQDVVAPRVKSEVQTWFLAHIVENGRLTVDLLLPSSVEQDQKTIHIEDRIFVGVFGFTGEDTDFSGPNGMPELPSGPTIRVVPR